MSSVLSIVLVLVLAYLLGALPFGLWVARVRGVDLRTVGSGNLGATNVYRTLGPKWGMLVLGLDALKGALAVLGARALSGGVVSLGGTALPGAGLPLEMAGGLAAIVGHVLTPFAGFRGGKGVATTIGVFLALAPAAMGVGLTAFVAAYAITQRVSVGSLALAAVFPIGIYLLQPQERRLPLLIMGVVASLLIIVRHLPNISRLARGTEPKTPLRARGRSDGESP